MDVMQRLTQQTELGVIPADWSIKQIGDLKPFVTSGSRGWAAFYTEYGGLFVRITNLSRSSIYLGLDDVRFVKVPLNNAEALRTEVQDGDMLISITADIGIIGYVSSRVPKPAYINQHIALVRFDASRTNSKFISYFLASGQPQRVFRALTDAGTKAGLNLATVQRVSLALPPTKAEQEAIAEALSDADALIESLEQLIAKKRHVKQGAMQELLTGKRRLPGFSGEWKEWVLLDLAEHKKELFDDGDWVEAEHITTEGIRLIQTGNIGIGTFIERDGRKYVFEQSFRTLRCKELCEGDLLICRLADPAGRACVLPNIGESKTITSVDVTVFRPPASLADRVFLANLFSTDDWFRAISDRSGGTTHKRISRGALGKMRIDIPPIEEQVAIASILSDMDAEITILEAKLSKARNIKQGTMQELLTGRIRLV